MLITTALIVGATALLGACRSSKSDGSPDTLDAAKLSWEASQYAQRGELEYARVTVPIMGPASLINDAGGGSIDAVRKGHLIHNACRQVMGPDFSKLVG